MYLLRRSARAAALCLSVVACSQSPSRSTSASVSASASTPKPQSSSVVSASSKAVPAAAEPGPDLKVAPMTLKLDDTVVELQADGTLVSNGKPVAKFVKNEVRTLDGKHVFSVAKDGMIWVDGEKNLDDARFNDQDELLGRHGDKPEMRITDDGKLSFATTDGEMLGGLVTFAGFTPAARRAALLTFMVHSMLADGDTPRVAPAPSASTGPSASPSASE
ncbi:MAG: hypothetical protein U0414_29995 [Polyangiaceae bacterium]